MVPHHSKDSHPPLPMYKKPTQYLSPGPIAGTNILPHFLSIKNLIWPPDPPNVQTPPKKPKTQLQVLIFFRQKAKGWLFLQRGDPRGNLQYITGAHHPRLVTLQSQAGNLPLDSHPPSPVRRPTNIPRMVIHLPQDGVKFRLIFL